MMQGGQRRTIHYACGFTIKGALTEVNAKHKRHIRLCSVCKTTEFPDMAFSNTNAKQNGWNGICKGKIVDRDDIMCRMLHDGSSSDIPIKMLPPEDNQDAIDFIMALTNEIIALDKFHIIAKISKPEAEYAKMSPKKLCLIAGLISTIAENNGLGFSYRT